MNKHDFYRELMSEYSFDAEKIRSNAKKGKFAKQKISPMTIGLTAAVAACTVACGTLAMTTLNDRNGVDLVGSNQSLSALSYSERVQNAIDQQNKVRDSEEPVDVMVTFSTPLSPKQAEAVIAAHTDGNVPVKTVYLADGSRIAGSAEVAAVFNGSSMITGMCIECAGSALTQLQDDSNIFLVELMSESDFDTITPIDPDGMETVEVDIPVYDYTENTTTSADDNDDDEPIVIDPVSDENTETEEAPVSGETTETFETTDTLEAVTDEAASEVTDTTESSSGETTESVESAETTEPEEIVVPSTSPALPDGVVLPVDPDRSTYSTGYIAAESAFFINNTTIYARLEDGFALYGYNGAEENLIEKIDCDSAKIHWIAENGGKMLVSGADANGMRSKLWLVDANTNNIIDLCAEDTVMNGTLTDVGYHVESNTVALIIKEDGKYYTYIMRLNASNEMEYIDYIFETTAKTELLGCNGKTVYIAVNDKTLATVYAVDVATAESRILKTFTGGPEFSKNLAFTHGIIEPSDSAITGTTLIFDASTESFIDLGINTSVTFGASKHSFSVNGSYYTVTGGSLISAGGINTIAPVDYKKSFSEYYAAYADDGYINITESVYTDENRSCALDFGHITSSNDAKFRDTVIGAIGMNNALALKLCAQSGMDRLDELHQALPVYYSANVVAQLKKLCSIPEYGALEYTTGQLTAINADDIELVISSVGDTSASGMLYIKAGSFGGKTAYRPVSISFVYEDGCWKLDNIIG